MNDSTFAPTLNPSCGSKLMADQASRWALGVLDGIRQRGGDVGSYELQAVQARNYRDSQEAFNGLWTLTRPLLVDFIHRKFPDLSGDDCEDVAQEVAISVWQGFKHGNFRGWLVLCGTRGCQRAFNHKKRTHSRPLLPLTDTIGRSAPNGVSVLLKAETAAHCHCEGTE